MRRFLLLLLMTGMAGAQTLTTYTGVIKDLSQQVVTSGQVTFTLSLPTSSTIPGIGTFIPSTTTCNINGDGTLSGYVGGVVSGACSVTMNTALTPTGTAYRICIQPYFTAPGSCFYDYAVTASKDITTVVPTLSTGPINYGGVPGPVGPTGPPGGSLSYPGVTTDGSSGLSVTGSVGAVKVGVTNTNSYTGSTFTSPGPFIGDGINPSTLFNYTNGATNWNTEIYGGVVVPASSTLIQSGGVAGQTDNKSTSTFAVGGYFGCVQEVPGLCWGANTLVEDRAGTAAASTLQGIEDDVNINNAATHGAGLSVTGGWTAQPTNFYAIDIFKPGLGAGATPGSSFQWPVGINFEPGATAVGIQLQQVGGALPQVSQSINFFSEDSTPTQHGSSVFLDTTGFLDFVGATGHGSIGPDGSVWAGLDHGAGVTSHNALNAIEPNLLVGNEVGITFGTAATSTYNSGLLSFDYFGGPGSSSNFLKLGLVGGVPLAIDGNGITTAPGLKVNTSVKAGAGLQHMRGALGCTTSATALSTCTTTPQTWALAFPDTNYTLSCSLEQTSGAIILFGETKSATTFTLTVITLNSAAGTGSYDCIAMHD